MAGNCQASRRWQTSKAAMSADLFKPRSRDAPPPGPFRYRHYGSMATIGRSTAVADFCGLSFKGLPAWILWGIAHVYFLIGFRNKLTVMLNWLWLYLTFQRGMRLITGAQE